LFNVAGEGELVETVGQLWVTLADMIAERFAVVPPQIGVGPLDQLTRRELADQLGSLVEATLHLKLDHLEPERDNSREIVQI
jgi:hypothetical protein